MSQEYSISWGKETNEIWQLTDSENIFYLLPW